MSIEVGGGVPLLSRISRLIFILQPGTDIHRFIERDICRKIFPSTKERFCRLGHSFKSSGKLLVEASNHP